MIPDEVIRAAVARHKQRETDRNNAEAEAEARRVEAEGAPRIEAEGRQAEAEKEQRAKLEKATKKVVIKIKKKGDGDMLKKRPRSRSPTVRVIRSRKAEPQAEAPVDLTADTPPEEAEVNAQPPQPSTAAEGGPTSPTIAHLPGVGPSPHASEHEAEKTRQDAGPSAPEVPPADTEERISLRYVAERGKWAEQTMSQVCLPAIEEGLLARGSAAFFRDTFAAQLWTVNSISTLRTVLLQTNLTVDELRREVDTAERAKEVAQVAEADMRARAEEAERALEEVRLQMKQETSNARAAERKLGEIETELLSCRLELHTITLQVRGAEERAENAEEVARASDARAAALSEQLKIAQEETAEAKKKATEAVADYQQSAAYQEAVADATVYAYNLGFKDCKQKVKQVFNLEGVEDLESDVSRFQQPSTPAAEDVAPSEP